LGDCDGFILEVVLELADAGLGTRRGAIELTERFHMQSLMRLLLVKFLEEGIEARLLPQKTLSGVLGSFFP
jgi:hypothetical protein